MTETKSNNHLKDVHFKITNSESGDLQFTIEPWAEEFTLRSGRTFDLKATFPINSNLIPHLIFHRKKLIVFECYDGAGCYFELKEGNEVLRTSDDYDFNSS